MLLHMAVSVVSCSVGDLEVIVFGRNRPTQADWDAHCERIRSAVAQGQISSRVFVISDGGGPSAAQRKQYFELLHPSARPERIAVCSSSVFLRGAMAAVARLSLPGLRSFRFDELYQAWSWLAPESVSFSELEGVVSTVQADNGWRGLGVAGSVVHV